MDGPWYSWKEGCNDPPKIMEDGYPAPSNWYLEAMLTRLYAMSIVEETNDYKR